MRGSAPRTGTGSSAWAEAGPDLPGQASVPVRLSDKLWRGCSERRSAEVGRSQLAAGLALWPRDAPPVVALAPVEGNRFRVALPERWTPSSSCPTSADRGASGSAIRPSRAG